MVDVDNVDHLDLEGQTIHLRDLILLGFHLRNDSTAACPRRIFLNSLRTMTVLHLYTELLRPTSGSFSRANLAISTASTVDGIAGRILSVADRTATFGRV